MVARRKRVTRASAKRAAAEEEDAKAVATACPEVDEPATEPAAVDAADNDVPALVSPPSSECCYENIMLRAMIITALLAAVVAGLVVGLSPDGIVIARSAHHVGGSGGDVAPPLWTAIPIIYTVTADTADALKHSAALLQQRARQRALNVHALLDSSAFMHSHTVSDALQAHTHRDACVYSWNRGRSEIQSTLLRARTAFPDLTHAIILAADTLVAADLTTLYEDPDCQRAMFDRHAPSVAAVLRDDRTWDGGVLCVRFNDDDDTVVAGVVPLPRHFNCYGLANATLDDECVRAGGTALRHRTAGCTALRWNDGTARPWYRNNTQCAFHAHYWPSAVAF